MLTYFYRTVWGEIILKFSPDEDMRKIERKFMSYGTILCVKYDEGEIHIQVDKADLDYVQRCIRQMRFKKPLK